MTGRILQRQEDSIWEYTLTAAAREEAGFKATEKYIRKRHNMSAQFIATRLIMELCEGTDRTLMAPVGMQWWEKSGIILTGAKERAEAATDVDADTGEDGGEQ